MKRTKFSNNVEVTYIEKNHIAVKILDLSKLSNDDIKKIVNLIHEKRSSYKYLYLAIEYYNKEVGNYIESIVVTNNSVIISAEIFKHKFQNLINLIKNIITKKEFNLLSKLENIYDPPDVIYNVKFLMSKDKFKIYKGDAFEFEMKKDSINIVTAISRWSSDNLSRFELLYNLLNSDLFNPNVKNKKIYMPCIYIDSHSVFSDALSTPHKLFYKILNMLIENNFSIKIYKTNSNNNMEIDKLYFDFDPKEKKLYISLPFISILNNHKYENDFISFFKLLQYINKNVLDKLSIEIDLLEHNYIYKITKKENKYKIENIDKLNQEFFFDKNIFFAMLQFVEENELFDKSPFINKMFSILC